MHCRLDESQCTVIDGVRAHRSDVSRTQIIGGGTGVVDSLLALQGCFAA